MSFLAFGLLIVVGIGYIGALGVRVNPPSDRTNLSMDVADINGLVVGSNVLLRGVEVGRVSGISTSVANATVDFYVDNRFRIPVDSEVRLDNLSALGESYIGLLPNDDDGPFLKDGQRIAAEAVTQPPSISELATSVVRVLNQLDPAALERIVNEADVALPDPNSVLPNLARASTVLRNTSASMDGRGQVLLSNFQTLLQNADWLGPTLADISPYLPRSGHSLGEIFRLLITGLVGNGSPEAMVNFRLYLTRIQKLLDDRGPDLKVLFESLLPHFQGIAGSLMNFDTGQMLTNILQTVPQEGAITLHVTVPGG